MTETTDIAAILPPQSASAFTITELLTHDPERAFAFCKFLSRSSLLPKDYTGKPENIMVGLMQATALGLPDPLLALGNISIVNGRPSLWGDLPLALAKRDTSFAGTIPAKYSGSLDDGTMECTIGVKRVERGETIEYVETFSIDDAKRAGLWKKSGPWTQYPKRMLRHRAMGYVLRDAFPDVFFSAAIVDEAPRQAEPISATVVRTASTPALPTSGALQADAEDQPAPEVVIPEMEPAVNTSAAPPMAEKEPPLGDDGEPDELVIHTAGTLKPDAPSPMLGEARAAAIQLQIPLWHTGTRHRNNRMTELSLWVCDKDAEVHVITGPEKGDCLIARDGAQAVELVERMREAQKDEQETEVAEAVAAEPAPEPHPDTESVVLVMGESTDPVDTTPGSIYLAPTGTVYVSESDTWTRIEPAEHPKVMGRLRPAMAEYLRGEMSAKRMHPGAFFKVCARIGGRQYAKPDEIPHDVLAVSIAQYGDSDEHRETIGTQPPPF